MGDLDAKLREIIFSNVTVNKIDIRGKTTLDWELNKDALAKIKEVFADEGYPTVRKDTGQEWYDRFEKEYYNVQEVKPIVGLSSEQAALRLTKHIETEVMKAAKRATGIDTEGE